MDQICHLKQEVKAFKKSLRDVNQQRAVVNQPVQGQDALDEAHFTNDIYR